jgi:beta-galactosidase
VPFNQGWLYAPRELSLHAPDSDFTTVTLPHANITLPYHNFDNLEYQFISTYRKRFTLPEPLNGRRLYVDFEGAMMASAVSINGRLLGEYDGGYTPFSFDLTDYLKEGENVLQVRLDSTERTDIPPYGNIVDYLTFGGIYREVSLRYEEPCHITNVFVRPGDLNGEIVFTEIDVYLRNQSDREQPVTLLIDFIGGHYAQHGLRDSLGVINGGYAVVPPHEETKATIRYGFGNGIARWTLDNPVLYTLRMRVQYGETKAPYGDYVTARFGLREAVFRDDGFYLNGEKIKLMGLNRHQTYPYIGGAAPRRLQRKDADIIKYELGCNIVRTSHYPQSPHFLERCDEIGLLVFEEIPGWQWIGDQDWKALSLDNVRRMIERDRNHPSIVLWGVRINESWDDEAFYKATNDLAHKLDPTRQTGGVRFFPESQFLEDVFTFNDFSNTVREPVHTPHLVTEFNGHMFPTKSFDQEERQVEHALRHARIQDKQMGMPNVSGAIGWCAFDYNTHREFGSGDRICYHGVMDIFRLPKFAAYFYESQIDPSVRPVLRPATFWTRGDRSGGGVNPLYVFSNCDEIEVFYGTESHGRYTPDREQFPNLPHAPFCVTAFSDTHMFASSYEDLRLVGYVNGEAVVEHRLSSNGVPHALTLEADDDELSADGSDMTRLVFKMVDKYGNRLPYAISVVSFEIEGPAELVGTNPFPLVGGQAAVYVRASQTPGTVKVRASAPRLNTAEVTIAIK